MKIDDTAHRSTLAAPSCSVLLRPAPSCSVLLRPAPSCSVLLRPAPSCSVLLRPAPSCSVLLRPAPSCSVLLRPAPSCSVLLRPAPSKTKRPVSPDRSPSHKHHSFAISAADVVQERGEPQRPIPSRCLTYPLQRTGRALPAQCPGRVLLARIPFGQAPFLHPLRGPVAAGRRDRPVHAPAHTVAFTTAVAVGGAGSVHRRTGMRAARALPGDRNRPGSPPATDCRQNPPPASPVNQTRCFAGHRRAWRCDAGPDLRRAVGVCTIGRTRGSHLTSTTGPRQTTSVRHLSGHPAAQERGCKMILKEPHARAA